jgi:hypothetical protein
MMNNAEVGSNAAEILQFAEGVHQSVVFVSNEMHNRLRNQIDSIIQLDDREHSIVGLYYRALMWLKSIEALNSSLHIQAIVSANRALLEIAVDLLYLNYDRDGGVTAQYIFWEESARLKIGEGAVRYFERMNQAVPFQYTPFAEFVANNRERIRSIREGFEWGTRHPDRWMNKNLGEAVSTVDKYETDLSNNRVGTSIIFEELGSSLEFIYANEYPRMNLFIHATGQSTLYRLTAQELDFASAQYSLACTKLAMFIMRIVLTDLGFARLPEFAVQWETFRKQVDDLRYSGVPRESDSAVR